MDDLRVHKLTNRKGIVVETLNYGARIISLTVPSDGAMHNVVLGYENLQDYLTDPFYIGCTAGRYANRINKGQLQIDGDIYQLDCNEGAHHLHGGRAGLDRVFWSVLEQSESSITYQTISADGNMGYPGTVDLKVTYHLDEHSKVTIEYTASSDRKTVVNLTNHSYFNLSSNCGRAADQFLKINADHLTVTNNDNIPTGELMPLKGSSLDFNHSRQISQAPDSDYNYCLSDVGAMKYAATLISKASGIQMDVYTSMPGLQFYSGAYLTGEFQPRSGICLEPQYFPDSPNQINFETPFAVPDNPYHEIIEFHFTTC